MLSVSAIFRCLYPAITLMIDSTLHLYLYLLPRMSFVINAVCTRMITLPLP